jgi:hypothetical protein
MVIYFIRRIQGADTVHDELIEDEEKFRDLKGTQSECTES